MEQRYSIITLGTADVARARAFYEECLGWHPFMTEGMTAYDMGGIVFGLFAHDALADDADLPHMPVATGSYHGFAVAYNARSEKEVDTILAHIETRGTAHGAKVLKAAHKAFWGGYSGYFADPDGHAWEVAFNPFWPVGDDGKLGLPETPA
ncbi:MAG: VOC family protein [Parvibaculum sp.]